MLLRSTRTTGSCEISESVVRRELFFFRLYPRRLADVITKAVLSSQLFKDPECWSGWDLNPQPSAQQSGALPTELTGRRRSWPVSCKTTSNLAEFFQSVLNARLDTVCHKRVAMRVISH